MASKYRAVYGARHGQVHQLTGEDGSRPIPQQKIDALMKSLNEHVKAVGEVANAHRKAQSSVK